MEKPVLVVMAAGMGSRYGGLKQIDPVGPNGQAILDYSIYDAKQAGFDTVIFVIKKSIEDVFKSTIGKRIEKIIKVKYAYQELSILPQGFKIPDGRIKPWGTSHAILSAKEFINGPFAVINSDDYYGANAFKILYDYLNNHQNDSAVYPFSMVGYELKNTVTDNGHVSRGVCITDSEDFLESVTEYTRIEKKDDKIVYTEDDGKTWHDISGNTTVSMNLWGFTKDFVLEAENRFADFLKKGLKENPLKCEYFLPSVVSELIEENKAKVKVLHSPDKWYGVTYKADKPVVVNAIAEMTAKGLYPSK